MAPFGHAEAAVFQQGTGVFGIQFVLRGAWQGDIAWQVPRTLTAKEVQVEVRSHLAKATTAYVLQLHQVQPLFFGQAVWGVQGAFGVRHRHHQPAQLHDFLRGKLRHVARTGNCHALPFNATVNALEHFLGEVHAAITRWLPDESGCRRS